MEVHKRADHAATTASSGLELHLHVRHGREMYNLIGMAYDHGLVWLCGIDGLDGDVCCLVAVHV
jgi:hypothetical protein